MDDLKDWKPCQRPKSEVLEGRFCRLEPLNAVLHGDDLYDAATAVDAASRFAYLPNTVPANRGEFDAWLADAENSDDPQFFAVIDMASGRAEGWQSFSRHDLVNGVIEIGYIYWGGAISRTRVTTEAFYLFASLIFEDLGYRRFEWKCNNLNGPSKRAAERFGMTFEGVFRQAAVVKGANRDTAWYSILDHEWPEMRARFQGWLAPENFDSQGVQLRKLNDF